MKPLAAQGNSAIMAMLKSSAPLGPKIALTSAPSVKPKRTPISGNRGPMDMVPSYRR